MATYPGAVPSLPGDGSVSHQQVADEIVAIAGELGVNPSGTFGSVAERLAAGGGGGGATFQVQDPVEHVIEIGPANSWGNFWGGSAESPGEWGYAEQWTATRSGLIRLEYPVLVEAEAEPGDSDFYFGPGGVAGVDYPSPGDNTNGIGWGDWHYLANVYDLSPVDEVEVQAGVTYALLYLNYDAATQAGFHLDASRIWTELEAFNAGKVTDRGVFSLASIGGVVTVRRELSVTNVVASGQHSHAEGYHTEARGFASHTEGLSTIASEAYAHAEGNTVTASGVASHAEGQSTLAQGDFAHVEGLSGWADGLGSHVEGYGGNAHAPFSHAEGMDGYVHPNAQAAHVEGLQTVANGEQAHAEGRETVADKDWSHAEGLRTKAFGVASHAQGGLTHANSDYSHAQGYMTRADGWISTASGQQTRAQGYLSTASGRKVTAETSFQFAYGVDGAGWGIQPTPLQIQQGPNLLIDTYVMAGLSRRYLLDISLFIEATNSPQQTAIYGRYGLAAIELLEMPLQAATSVSAYGLDDFPDLSIHKMPYAGGSSAENVFVEVSGLPEYEFHIHAVTTFTRLMEPTEIAETDA